MTEDTDFEWFVVFKIVLAGGLQFSASQVNWMKSLFLNNKIQVLPSPSELRRELLRAFEISTEAVFFNFYLC